MRFSYLTGVLLALTCGCSGQSIEVGMAGAAGMSSLTGGASGGTAGAPVSVPNPDPVADVTTACPDAVAGAPAFPPACSVSEYAQASSSTEIMQQLIGTWFACENPTIFGSNEYGIRIDSDMTWAKVTVDDTGALVFGHGFDDSGTWDVSDSTQVDFHWGPGSNGGGVEFATSPHKMRLHFDVAPFSTDYVWAASACQ